MSTADLTGGVKINPMPPRNGDQAVVSYNGKLASKSNNITLNIGYGEPNNFFDTQRVNMQKQGNELQGSFTVKFSDRINMYFEDANGNKDDNNGSFYQTLVDSDNLSYS